MICICYTDTVHTQVMRSGLQLTRQKGLQTPECRKNMMSAVKGKDHPVWIVCLYRTGAIVIEIVLICILFRVNVSFKFWPRHWKQFPRWWWGTNVSYFLCPSTRMHCSDTEPSDVWMCPEQSPFCFVLMASRQRPLVCWSHKQALKGNKKKGIFTEPI